MDGVVPAQSALDRVVNVRSAVVLGTAMMVGDDAGKLTMGAYSPASGLRISGMAELGQTTA